MCPKLILSVRFFHIFNKLQISTEQSRSCSAWNISLHEYSPSEDDPHHAGVLLHLFCPRDRKKQYIMPWKLSTVVIR